MKTHIKLTASGTGRKLLVPVTSMFMQLQDGKCFVTITDSHKVHVEESLEEIENLLSGPDKMFHESFLR